MTIGVRRSLIPRAAVRFQQSQRTRNAYKTVTVRLCAPATQGRNYNTNKTLAGHQRSRSVHTSLIVIPDWLQHKKDGIPYSRQAAIIGHDREPLPLQLTEAKNRNLNRTNQNHVINQQNTRTCRFLTCRLTPVLFCNTTSLGRLP